jgi:hypothetical protein
MTRLQIRAFLYQLGCFASLFILARYLVERYWDNWILGSFIAFVIGTFSTKFKL